MELTDQGMPEGDGFCERSHCLVGATQGLLCGCAESLIGGPNFQTGVVRNLL
jgi:hypothetical protein